MGIAAYCEQWRWRGAMGPVRHTALEWSWTTDRDRACWFATWHYERMGGKRTGRPMMVVRATGTKQPDQAHRCRDEAEMVIFGARTAEQDGTEDEWRERSALLAAEQKAEQDEWLERVAT